MLHNSLFLNANGGKAWLLITVFVVHIFCSSSASASAANRVNRVTDTISKAHRQDPAAQWYYDNWCGAGLEYLADSKCQKVFPAEFDPDWSCPVRVLAQPPSASSGYQLEAPLGQMQVDTQSLAGLVDPSVASVCVVLTKRVRNESAESGVSLYNKYYCAGNSSMQTPFETWSSSKIFAMSNAAGKLREVSQQKEEAQHRDQIVGDYPTCDASSQFGVADTVCQSTLNGWLPLGDLATIVCSYDLTAGYTSNALSSYFHDLGWRERIHNLVCTGQEGCTDWLFGKTAVNGAEEISLGGNYGASTPSDLTYNLEHLHSQNRPPTVDGNDVCTAEKDPWPQVYLNSLSALAAAEMTRRIVQYRELRSDLRFPGAEWEDMQTIMYGTNKDSVLFPGELWGGMTADTAIFLQTVLEKLTMHKEIVKDRVDVDQNQWRIFSKLGAGYYSGYETGEIVTNAYTCMPYNVFSDEKSILRDNIELTITARASVSYDYDLTQAEQYVLDAVVKSVQFVINDDAKNFQE